MQTEAQGDARLSCHPLNCPWICQLFGLRFLIFLLVPPEFGFLFFVFVFSVFDLVLVLVLVLVPSSSRTFL